jgi:PPOX class probable F420-dependent enzyme
MTHHLPDDVRALLDGPNVAHLATVLPGGGPHAVPVWVGLEGDRVAFLTDPQSRKARNIEHEPRVAISMTARDQPYTMAHIRGRVAERIEGDAAWTVIHRIAHKYTGQPYAMPGERVVYLIEPERAWARSFA